MTQILPIKGSHTKRTDRIYIITIKFDDCSNISMQVIELKLTVRKNFLGIQKCLTDGKYKLGLGEWIETHRKRQEIIDIPDRRKQMEPWKKVVLLRTEQFGKIPQRNQRGEISESTKHFL